MRRLPLVAAALIAGCSQPDTPPGAMSDDDQRRLNEAAAMLDANSVQPAAADEPAADQRLIDNDVDDPG